MRNLVFILLMAMAIDVNAQMVEQVDSIDLETGVICPAKNAEVVGTIKYSEFETSKIPQIPFEELDSMTMSSLDNRVMLSSIKVVNVEYMI